MRTRFVVGVGLLLGLSGICTGEDEATAPATQPAAAASSQPAAIKVVPVPWKTPVWQDAPDEAGQYLLCPSAQAQFEVDGRQYLATSFGVLVCEPLPLGAGPTPPAPWPGKIVPELYRKNLQPLEIKGDLLWAVVGTPRGKQQKDPVQVQALDVKDWSVKKKLDLPPHAVPVRVDDDGCWFVQPGPSGLATGGEVPVQGQSLAMPPSYGSIVLLSFEGKEEFRFDAQQQPATAPSPTQPADQRPPNPRIYWWGIDPEALWLGIIDFRGILPNDAPVYGPTQFIRVDRAGGKRITVEAPQWPGRLTVNTPQRILWLQMDNSAKGKRYYRVRQLDKKSLEISQAGRLEVESIDDIAADENFLWVRQWVEGDHRTRAFALKDFSEVLEAGLPPAEPPFKFSPPTPAGLLLLGGDAGRVWFAHDRQILELPDDGDAFVRPMPLQVMPSPFVHPADAESGSLYAAVGLQLFRVTSGSDQVLMQEVPLKLSSGFGLLRLGAGSLWANAHPELLAFSDGLVLERRMPMPAASAMTVVDKTCFYFALGNAPGLFKLDFVGDPVRIESWDRRTREWFKNTYKLDEPSPDSLKQMSSPWWMGTDGAGKIFVLCQRPSDPRLDAAANQVGMMLWTYDIAKDEWQDKDLGAGLQMTTINAGPKKVVLFNTQHKGPADDPGAFVVFFNGRLEPLGPLPKGWLSSTEYDYYGRWRIHATDKYVYAWTPLGLWRTPREEKK